MTATFGSLFSGIGGIDLGLERAGWECQFQVEWDAYCQHVLAHRWPDVPRYGDITEVDWRAVPRVDLLAGGFPCQPFSLAGQRRGKADDRWLWPAFAAAIRALRPSYILVENVPGILAGHGGMGAVLGDLAELGYDAEWDSIPAAAVGAPHLRYRVWIVAYPHDIGGLGISGLFDSFRASFRDDPDGRGGAVPDPDCEALWHEPVAVGRSGNPPVAGLNGSLGHVADTAGERLEAPRPAAPGYGLGLGPLAGIQGDVADTDCCHAQGQLGQCDDSPDGREPSERQAGLRDRAGRHRGWATEPDVGRVAHGVPARVDRLRALGNAVVPQVVEVIGAQLIRSLEAAA